MRTRREIFYAAGLIMLLLLITVGGSLLNMREQLPAYSSLSNAPDGARALRLWLEEMGYRVNDQTGATFSIPSGTDQVIILEPLLTSNITKQDWKKISDWVSNGGQVLLASSAMRASLANSSLEIDTLPISEKTFQLLPGGPYFQSPPLEKPVSFTAHTLMSTLQSGALPLFSSDQGDLALELRLGKGSILLFTDAAFLTNAGLRDPGHARLALNLVSRLARGSQIWIDEWHHGIRAAEAPSGPEAWLGRTPAGHAMLYSALVIFCVIALGGRRFGRPVPLDRSQARRTPIEMVNAQANLSRRAGHRKALMQYYHTRLKRSLGRRYRLDANLPDESYVRQLAQFDPGLDSNELLKLLQELSAPNLSEPQVVQCARKAATWIQEAEHRGSSG
jgi:hypothetical protein